MSLPQVEGVEFRPAYGLPGYAVGNDGSVWTCKIQGHHGRIGGKWRRISTHLVRRRLAWYRTVVLYGVPAVNKYKTCYVHRLVLEAFVGPAPPGLVACHGDGNPQNNNLTNLRWDTRKANEDDKERHGRRRKGESHQNARLIAADVREIRRLVSGGMTHRAVAEKFGLARTSVSGIVHKRIWAHLS